MRVIRALILIIVCYVVCNPHARAEEQCPTGPFETDVRAIATAEAAKSLKSNDWEEGGYWGEPKQLVDGANWEWSGGLLSTAGHRLTYDAKRYVVVGVTIEFDRRKARDIPPAHGFQVISRRDSGTFVRTVIRPKPEEARKFACLANQLLASSAKSESPSESVLAGATRTSPESSVVATPGEECISGIGYAEEGSDEWSSRFELLRNGSIAEYRGAVPCIDPRALIDNMEELVRNMLDRATTGSFQREKWYEP